MRAEIRGCGADGIQGCGGGYVALSAAVGRGRGSAGGRVLAKEGWKAWTRWEKKARCTAG